ncbi:metalloprotease, partial [Coemansia aciculifera]
MLAENGPQEWYYQELALISKAEFDFKEREDAENYALSLSSGGLNQNIPPHQILSHDSLFSGYDADLISKCLSYLNPGNYRLFIGAQEHKSIECELEEKYYGILYHIADLPSHMTLDVKCSPSVAKMLHLPGRNIYLPESLSVTKPATIADTPALEPVLLRKNDKFEAWFKQDDQFFTPHGRIGLTISSEQLDNVNVASAFDQDMLEGALKDITLDGLQAHIESIFSKAYVKMLVSGNYNQLVALDASNQVLDILQFQPIPKSLINTHRSLDIEPGYYVQNLPIKSNPAYVTQRINRFIRQYRQKLQELTVEEFDSSVQSLISLKQEKLKSIDDEFFQLWAPINSDKYNFGKLDEGIKHLKQLRKDNLLAFWDKYVNEDTAQGYTRLDMQMSSTKIWQPTAEEFEMYPSTVLALYGSLRSAGHTGLSIGDVQSFVLSVDASSSIESLLAELSKLYMSKQVSPASSETTEVTNTVVADMEEPRIVFESSSKTATALQMAISSAKEAPKFATLSKTNFANIDMK